ncbi:unnamed protein product [Leptidea sinapis]|uniref:Peroxisomal leader peptide-processing protease n=1 Tax=Leptidea sinapis TaxID=189913 RepID=A0A5E4QAI7_9NEOP|nr:unnamed protein product [Leptidea sinapis]
MVSYNYSDDGELANILTVAASGIKFSKRWVLTHGSILSPLKQAKVIADARGKAIINEEFYNQLPEIYVTCEKKQTVEPVYREVEKISRERSLDSNIDFDHSSYQCPVLERCVDDVLYSWTVGYRDVDVDKQSNLGKALLSVFVLVDLESETPGLKTLRPLSELFDMVRAPPERGANIHVFLNAVTTGTVCGLVGKRPSLLLTDAATALGSEDRIDRVTMLVRCGSAWGAGVYLGGGYVVTCAHVVKNHASNKVSVYCQSGMETAIVRYKSKDDIAYDLALLFTNPQCWSHLLPADFSDDPAEKGEPVLAAGYPYFNENNLQGLKPTVTSGHVNTASPSMLQTSCCVQSGFSGGPIFRISRSSRVEVLGIIVSNAKTVTGACYPYINMAVPATAFLRLVQQFILDKDASKLSAIEHKEDMIQSQWRVFID